MKLLYFISLIFLVAIADVNGQVSEVIRTDDNFSDQELVEDILLKGFCKNVENVRVKGENFSVGHFSSGEVTIGIDEGIIISTGNIASASGPNNSPRTSEIIGTTGDPDLEQLATSGIFDASGISFDFVPIGNRVSFRYVFASEEYCEFVNTPFNDVFGFFVSGPGINGDFDNDALNVARIPGTNEFVSINTVNHGRNADLYRKNETEEDALFCNIEFLPLFAGAIEYDGFTLPLQAVFQVIPCETYTIRLVVADVQDPILDSAVFLEMNSFDIGGNVQIIAASETGDEPIASESCTNGIFRFERSVSDAAQSETVAFRVNPSSTATSGVDFEDIPNSITFEPGETSVELVIEIIADGENEAQETFGLLLDYDCECFDEEEAMLFINDDLLFETNFDDIEVCSDQEFFLYPEIVGGAPPYQFLWNDGSTSDSLFTIINTGGNFSVTVTDFCGRESVGNAQVGITLPPEINFVGSYDICPNQDQLIPLTFDGVAPWNITYRVNDEQEITISDIIENPYNLIARKAGTYQITFFEDRYCTGISNGSVTVEEQTISVQPTITQPTCPNVSDGSILLNIQSANEPLSVEWFPSVNDVFNPTELGEGIYSLVIIDSEMCRFTESINLQSPNGMSETCLKLNIFIPNSFSPNNDGINDRFLIYLDSEPSIVQLDELNIYDRWGNLVFQTQNLATDIQDVGFDGTFRQQDIQASVLTYVMVLQMNDNSNRVVSGDLTLLR